MKTVLWTVISIEPAVGYRKPLALGRQGWVIFFERKSPSCQGHYKVVRF